MFNQQFVVVVVVFFIQPQNLLQSLFQAEDGIRDVERSRGLGDVYKRQGRQSSYIVLAIVYE